jgi:hypothetical protein
MHGASALRSFPLAFYALCTGEKLFRSPRYGTVCASLEGIFIDDSCRVEL